MAQKRKRRETFGALRKLPSGRYQASYLGPDGKRYAAPQTFDNMGDGRAWLSRKRLEISDDDWRAPRQDGPVTFDAYAREHIDTRTNARGERLKPRTRDEYLRLLDGPLTEFRESLLTAITPEQVRRWYSDQERTGKRTQASRAYRLLKSVMATAIADGYVKSNPCQIRGATKAATGKDVTPPTDAELAIIVATIDPRLSLLVEIAAWGGLRWGEITELRRGDVMLSDHAILSVTRAVTYTKSEGYTVGLPKSFAGIRTVALPVSLAAPLRGRLDAIDTRDDALIFPSLSDPTKHLSSGAFALYWRRARAAAGRSDMPFHALRHFGATRYAMAGATAKELMRRMGHNDVVVAMRYQHDAGRDAELVRRMTDT